MEFWAPAAGHGDMQEHVREVGKGRREAGSLEPSEGRVGSESEPSVFLGAERPVG